MSRRAVLLLLQSLLGLGLLAAWLSFVDLSSIAGRLAAVRWPAILLVLAAGTSAYFLRAARWRLLLRPISAQPLGDIVSIVFASTLVNFLLPLRTGELARSFLLKQRRGVTAAGSLATLAVDRAFDLAVVLALAAGGALALPAGTGFGWWVLAGLALLVALAALIFVASKRWSGGFQARLLRLVPARLRTSAESVLERFLEGLSTTARAPGILAPALGLSALALTLDSAAFYVLLVGVGGHPDPRLAALGYALFVLTYLVPAAPGYVGTAEAFGSLVFVGIGLPVDVASSAVLLSHATNAVLVLVLGLIGFAGIGLRPAVAVRALLREGAPGDVKPSEAPPQPPS